MNVSHPHRRAGRRDPASNVAAPRRTRTRSRARAGALLLAAGTAGAALAAIAQPAALAAPAGHALSTRAGQPTGPLAPASAASGPISWSLTPASASGPDTRNLFAYNGIKPGATITDHVAVFNRSAQSVAFTLYATDATGTTARNALTLLPAAARPRDIGSWVHFPHHVARLSVIIPAHRGAVEVFSLAVPRSATPGDHTGGMIASVGLNRKDSRGQLVTLDERVAIPLELRVAGPLHAGLGVQSISAGFSTALSPFSDGAATVSYTLTNTGNVRLAGSQIVSVTGPFGIASRLRPARVPVVLPGDSVRLTLRAPGLYPAGPLSAHVHVTPANPAGAPPIPEPVADVSGDASLFAVPWPAVGLAILLGLVVVGGWQAWRWRRRRLGAVLTAVAANARLEAELRLQGDSGKAAAGADGTTSS